MVSEFPSERGRSRSRSRERRRNESPDARKTRARSPGGEDMQLSGGRSKSPVTRDQEKERRRPTWFDIQPVAGAPPPISDLPGAVQVIPESISGNLASSVQSGAANQQATRHARRIYVGGLPTHAKEEDIATFFRCDCHIYFLPLFPLVHLFLTCYRLIFLVAMLWQL